MRNLGKYVKKYGILYVVAIAAMVVSILLDAASPQITRHIIDDVIVGGKMEMLMRLLLGLLGIGLGRAIFQYMKFISICLACEVPDAIFGRNTEHTSLQTCCSNVIGDNFY